MVLSPGGRKNRGRTVLKGGRLSDLGMRRFRMGERELYGGTMIAYLRKGKKSGNVSEDSETRI